jgi:formylglycine-generating enzyme required for sulfatase activity
VKQLVGPIGYSEAEWEYAARTGGDPLPWGHISSHEEGNFGYTYGGAVGGRDQYQFTAPVGSFPANTFGLHDVLGNVGEWVEDCYHETYVGAPADGSAWTSGECSYRVFRGGSWHGDAEALTTHRFVALPTERQGGTGFRVARALDRD